jgi:hypothetical protein
VASADLILGLAADAGLDFAVYARRDCEQLTREQLTREQLAAALAAGTVSAEEIAAAFAAALSEALGP